MSKIKILGIGSPFGDDRVGWEVVDQIMSSQKLLTDFITIEKCDRPGMNLLHKIENVETAYIIDAMLTGAPVGTIAYYQNEEIMTVNPPKISSHAIGLSETLELGRTLQILPKNIVFYGIEIDESNHSFTLSPKASEAVNKVAIQMIKICEQAFNL